MSGEQPLLPSLLDRLTDDSYILHGIAACKQEVGRLEQQLKTAREVGSTEEDCNRWLREIAKQRAHENYLRGVVGSFENIRESVKRDLGWLLNCRSYYSHNTNTYPPTISELDEGRFPEMAGSVLNYGLPDLTGRTASSLQKPRLEKVLKQVLLRFEPRIIPETLTCTVLTEDSMLDHNMLVFEINGMLWAEPAPVHLQIRTQLDLENGDVLITE